MSFKAGTVLRGDARSFVSVKFPVAVLANDLVSPVVEQVIEWELLVRH